MSEQEKIAILAECMDVDEEELSVEKKLDSFDEWDSVAALALMATMDEHFGKTIESSDIKKLITVNDVLKMME